MISIKKKINIYIFTKNLDYHLYHQILDDHLYDNANLIHNY